MVATQLTAIHSSNIRTIIDFKIGKDENEYFLFAVIMYHYVFKCPIVISELENKKAILAIPRLVKVTEDIINHLWRPGSHISALVWTPVRTHV